ncbi:protein Sco1p, mitochondrial [Trichomonascus vanleenenianus]|uniref:SCO family protein n=1 Tax=Trichomonascus vanleenenianus TaxID=2268995 RepID=UPI003ECADA43
MLNRSARLWSTVGPLRTGPDSRRLFGSARVLFNEAKKDEKEDLASRGVKDPGTAVHGYDPLKPRKPLSRIAIGDQKRYDPERAERQKLVGMLNWKAALLFILTGAGLTWYFVKEKARVDQEREAALNKGIGKPKVGGPFNLVDHNGNKFTDKDLHGKFSLVYFGFSHCPDICPEELDNMVEMIEDINRDTEVFKPIFITCDPHRDTPEVLKDYLAEFHPSILGLTGTYDDIKQTCKHYRVYFSTPADLKPGQDYLVDHSIFFYLMDPQGQFVDALGRNNTPKEASDKIKQHIKEWKPDPNL